MTQPILQFGTGRFLQAHVDLFVSQALARGEAIGGITVVQTTNSPQSSARVAALAQGRGYDVEILGRIDGEVVRETVHVDSVRAALNASSDWAGILGAIAGPVKVIVSNTADQGYALSSNDTAELLKSPATVPESFPAKLLALLHHRWSCIPEAPLSIYPCELVSRNGDVLGDIVFSLAQSWHTSSKFLVYLRERCVWVNSLVDRIVSAPIEPIGAVAEPFALWVIERQEGMLLPCLHPAIVVTDRLEHYERLKLMLLNLGHSVLAERWLAEQRRSDETVFEAMNRPALRDELEAVWRDEVLPVFEADGEGDEARAYLVGLRNRMLNPFLEHRLSDIAKDHEEKKRRRFAPVVARAQALGLGLRQRFLEAALSSGDMGSGP